MSSEHHPPKTLLVGLDAACWEYLDPLLQAKKLPNLERLLHQGTSGTLRSVMPPITPAAWSSLVTGVNPGKHGVFEWVQRRPGDYSFVPVDARQRCGTPVWKRLNAAGIRTGVVNIPLTYPVEPLDGFLLCGFSAPPSKRDLTYPASLLNEIEARYGPYQPDVDMPPEGTWSPGAYQAERSFQERQVRTAAWLANVHQVHVLILNLMLLDHANHTMPDEAVVEQAIIDSDADLGLLLDEFAPDNVMLISDHGSRRVRGVFLMQAWLAEQGVLKRPPRPVNSQAQVANFLLRRMQNGRSHLANRIYRRILREALVRLPHTWTTSLRSRLESAIPLANLQIETLDRFVPAETRVFQPGGHRGSLTINLVGREPQGVVQPEEKEALTAELIEKLSAVCDPETGEKVFPAIYRPEEIYSGPFTAHAPDLIGDYYGSRWSVVSKLPGLHPRPWRYFMVGERWFGDHSRDGIFVFAGRDFATQPGRSQAHLLDIPATLLYIYGVPQPEDYDGQPLVQTLKPERAAELQLRYQPGDLRTVQEPRLQSPEEEDRAIRERLKALGYLGG